MFNSNLNKGFIPSNNTQKVRILRNNNRLTPHNASGNGL